MPGFGSSPLGLIRLLTLDAYMKKAQTANKPSQKPRPWNVDSVKMAKKCTLSSKLLYTVYVIPDM